MCEGCIQNCQSRGEQYRPLCSVPMLYVKKLHPKAKLPTCAHPGEDLAYDLYALEAITIPAGGMAKIRTGISIEFRPKAGALIRDRSSVASGGLAVVGGVIDAGYRGEIIVVMMNHNRCDGDYIIFPGGKIAQMIPVVPNTTHNVVEVDELAEAGRGDKGFGSTGR